MAYDWTKLLGSAAGSLLGSAYGGLKSQNTGSVGQTSMRDYLGGYGVTPSWSASNPNYTAIGQNSYKVGSIPGTRYDPTSSTHYVTDKTALNKALGFPYKEQAAATTTPTTTTPYPTEPTYKTSMPEVPEITWDEALSRAESMYRPAYESSVLTRDKMASDQRERIAQMLGTRGYANPRGGMRQTGEYNITQDQAAALEGLRNSYETQKQQAAYNIYEGETGKARNALADLVNQQNNENTLAYNTWNTKMSAATQKNTAERNQESTLLWKIIDWLESREGGS